MMDSVINNPLIVKAGTITAWGSITIPYGWLLCDGSAISRTTYKALFNAIGTNYGAGDGTTTFNLPNGRISVGNAPVIGSGTSLGLTDGTNYFSFLGHDTGHTLKSKSGNYGRIVGSASPSGSSTSTTATIIGVVTDPENSGLVIDSSNQSRAIIKY